MDINFPITENQLVRLRILCSFHLRGVMESLKDIKIVPVGNYVERTLRMSYWKTSERTNSTLSQDPNSENVRKHFRVKLTF
jgi:hypothetical protein